jgi:hypothetical protein
MGAPGQELNFQRDFGGKGIKNYENLLCFRYSISHQIEEDHPQFYKNPIFGYTKYAQLFVGLSVNLMNLQLLQWLADLLGARKEMTHILNKNHGAHWLFHLQGIYTTSNFTAQ